MILAPSVLCSDVLFDSEIDLVADGQTLPIRDGQLDRVFMVNVLHHMSDISSCLAEIQRVLVDGGALVMIEPYKTGAPGRTICRNATTPRHSALC